MRPFNLRRTVVCVILIISLQLISCGTLLHPDRRGQTSGRIDPGIAVLDGIGLIFFIIPGLIAYAIDFNTGGRSTCRARSRGKTAPAPLAGWACSRSGTNLRCLWDSETGSDASGVISRARRPCHNALTTCHSVRPELCHFGYKVQLPPAIPSFRFT